MKDQPSDLLNYIVNARVEPGEQLPTLKTLSDELGISVNKLREQLEVARVLGMVDVRPRAGTRVQPYDFLPAVRLSLLYAVAMDRGYFEPFSALRRQLEVAFWEDAVTALGPAEHDRLDALIAQAWAKLNDQPARIPHGEHREFHQTIFSRLDNPFVTALLEAFWEAYEAIEYHIYSDYRYLCDVWAYHQRIADAIRAGDIAASQEAYLQHTRLIRCRTHPDEETPAPARTTLNADRIVMPSAGDD
ncbi:MAG: FadR family transcriptional regulator [Anaerolineae bacterium]|nr:FadR family transcriptional regulator [Anaerolineae bacterium]